MACDADRCAWASIRGSVVWVCAVDVLQSRHQLDFAAAQNSSLINQGEKRCCNFFWLGSLSSLGHASGCRSKDIPSHYTERASGEAITCWL